MTAKCFQRRLASHCRIVEKIGGLRIQIALSIKIASDVKNVGNTPSHVIILVSKNSNSACGVGQLFTSPRIRFSVLNLNTTLRGGPLIIIGEQNMPKPETSNTPKVSGSTAR